VWRRAIDRAVNWRRNDQKPARIAVNVTAIGIPFPAIHFAVGNSSHEEVIAGVVGGGTGQRNRPHQRIGALPPGNVGELA